MIKIMNDKEKFIDIMSKIKIGSIIFYKKDYYDDCVIQQDTVIKIYECKNGSHEGCRYCQGLIVLKEKNRLNCFKEKGDWHTKIVSVINEGFITEEEFKIK